MTKTQDPSTALIFLVDVSRAKINFAQDDKYWRTKIVVNVVLIVGQRVYERGLQFILQFRVKLCACGGEVEDVNGHLAFCIN